nr:carboxypeptidase-like regulatory domain-containing protein [Planctomycetota bacterium]
GVVTLGVVAAKRTFARVAVVTTPTDGPVTIVLPAGAATIESVVSDPQGAPVAGASVLLELEVPPATEGADAKAVVTLRLGARTDDAGRVRFENVPSGHLTSLRAAAEGFRSTRRFRGGPDWTDVEVVEGKTTQLDITLFRGSVVTGRVTRGEDGPGLANAQVTLYFKGWHPPQRLDTTTDATGQFTFEGVGQGAFFLLAWHRTHFSPEVAQALDPTGRMVAGRRSTPATLTLEIGAKDATYERNIVLEAGTTLRGRVVGPDGDGVSGARIHARHYTMQWLAQNWGIGRFYGASDLTLATSGDDGAFVIEGAPPREGWVLFARREGYAGTYSDPVDIRPGAEIEGIVLRLVAGCTVRGRVTGEDGAGLGQVSVLVSGRSELRGTADARVTTQDDGTFEFTSLPAASLTLSVFRSGSQTVRVNLTGLTPGEVREDVVLAFETGVDVTGVVTDPQGKPVAQLGLTAHYRDQRAPHSAYTTTNGKGAFRFRGIPPGKIQISARDGQRGVMLTQIIEAPSSDHRLTFQATPVTTIKGTVVGPDGEPIPGCTVIGRTKDGRPVRANRSGRVTGGAFSLAMQGDGPFWVTASDPTDADGKPLNLRFVSVKVDDPAQPVTLRMEAGGTIRGRVVDEDGKPVADVRVLAGSRRVTTGVDGRFELLGLADGAVMLHATPPAPFMRPAGVSAAPGDIDVVIRLRAGLEIKGRVALPEGTQLTGGSVTATWTDRASGTQRSHSRLSESGSFKVTGLPADVRVDIEVRPWHRGEAGVRLAPGAVRGVRAGTHDLVVTLVAGVELSGVVVDARGEPVTGAHVSAVGKAPTFGNHSVRVGDKGAFRLRGLLPGTYELSVSESGGTVTMVGEHAAPRADLRIALPERGTLRGRVLGERGDHVWHVVAYGVSDGRWLPGGHVEVAADGTWEITSVPTDRRWMVKAYAQARINQYAMAGPFDAGRADIELQVQTGREIRGRVVRAGKPVTNCFVTASSDAYSSTTSCDAEGRFTVHALPPGTYTVTAGFYNSQDKAFVEGVAAGATDVVLEFE